MRPSRGDLGKRRTGRWSAFLSLLVATLVVLAPGAVASPSDEVPPGTFAIIDGVAVPEAEFEAYFANFARTRYYHGLTATRLAEIRPKAAESFVENHLLLREAERRGIAGDPQQVEQQVAALEARYGDSNSWQAIEPKLPELRRRLLEVTKVEALEAAVKSLPDPEPAELERFYQENIRLFTLPRQVHLAVILVGVPPDAFAEQRQEAEARAEVLHQRLKSGADFSDLAKEESTHESAEEGGDIGFLHLGELSEASQEAVDQLAPGEFTPPILVLEGYALFKLIARKPEQIQPLAAVRERALALYRRHRSQETWQQFIAALRQKADVKINAGETAPRQDSD